MVRGPEALEEQSDTYHFALDLTTAVEQETGSLAAMVDDLEESLDVQDVENLRELFESMYEGLVTFKETHAKVRDKTKMSRLSSVGFLLDSCFLDALCFAHWLTSCWCLVPWTTR